MNKNIHFWSHLVQFFVEWEMFQTNVVEKIKTQFHVQYIFFFENRAIYEIMREEYGRANQATEEDMAHAHCMLDT